MTTENTHTDDIVEEKVYLVMQRLMEKLSAPLRAQKPIQKELVSGFGAEVYGEGGDFELSEDEAQLFHHLDPMVFSLAFESEDQVYQAKKEETNIPLFTTSMTYILHELKGGNKNPNLRLCHGLATGRTWFYGNKFEFAWVETTQGDFSACEECSKNHVALCVVPSRILMLSRDLLYSVMGIQPQYRVRYAPEEVVVQMMSNISDAGPWHNLSGRA